MNNINTKNHVDYVYSRFFNYMGGIQNGKIRIKSNKRN